LALRRILAEVLWFAAIAD